MTPLSELGSDEAIRLDGLIFDLDDTVLDGGLLTEAAYAALFRLREARLRLVACTGRPAGWGEVIARQWPVDAVVTENGAVAWTRDATNLTRPILRSNVDREALRVRRSALLAYADELVARFPETALADDNDLRWTDVTLDVGEHRRVPPEVVREMKAMALRDGLRSVVSSVHLHLSREVDDKASGTLRVLERLWAEDPTRARSRYAFVGDSENDAVAFAAFETTLGVANVARHVKGLTLPPRFVATESRGRGFAEIAQRLAALRASR